jgi:hypothetical protein
LILFIPCICFTQYVHDLSIDVWRYGALSLSSAFPIALLYNSKVIGTYAIGALWQFLGFGIIPLFDGFLVGYTDTTSLYVGTIVSFTMTIISTVMQHTTIQVHHVFKPGCVIFGSIVFGVSGLILSSMDKLATILFPLCEFGIGISTNDFFTMSVSGTFIVLWILQQLSMLFGKFIWLVIMFSSIGVTQIL